MTEPLELELRVSREAVVNADPVEVRLLWDSPAIAPLSVYCFQAAAIAVRAHHRPSGAIEIALVKDATVHGPGDNSAITDAEAIRVARPRLAGRIRARLDQ